MVPDFPVIPGWTIGVHERGTAFVAERRTGTAVRVLVAHDLDTLRAKIERVTEQDTP